MMSRSWSNGYESYRYARHADIPAIVSMLSDPEVCRWLWFTPIDETGVRAFFEPLLDRQAGELNEGATPKSAVVSVLGAADEFLGQGAVMAVEGSPDGYEIGFQLTRSAWGRGVGSRLGEFLCAYAIVCNRAYRIEGACLEGNAGSATVMRKLGLRLEGTLPGFRLRDGVRHTELRFGREVSQLDTARFEAIAERVGLAGQA